jgi:hypothetical protein
MMFSTDKQTQFQILPLSQKKKKKLLNFCIDTQKRYISIYTIKIYLDTFVCSKFEQLILERSEYFFILSYLKMINVLV